MNSCQVTAWERYMACDHGPRHSMTCFSRFWLSRPVTSDAFTQAVVAMAREHPFLAVTRRGRSWLPVAFDHARQIDWNDAAVPVEWGHLPPDDTLVRWSARVGRLGDLGLAEDGFADMPGTLVVLRYPHAVADGLAAIAVVGSLCEALGGAVGSARRQELNAGETLGRRPRAARRHIQREWSRIARYFLRLPTEFAGADRTAAAHGHADVVFERVVAPADETRSLRAAARALGVTLNDVLLAALFRTLAPHVHRRGVVRVAVPTSLRSEGDLTFRNRVSMVFLDRVAARVADAGLLRALSAEMTDVKRWKLGHAMHVALAVLCATGDGLLRRILRLPLVSTTAVLSNVGDPFATFTGPEDSVRVVAHDLLSPLRPGTNLAVSVAGHDGRLGLTARFAPDRISRQRARELLQRLLVEAEAVLAEERDRPAAATRAPLWRPRSPR